jgi:hypothetical protein
MGCPMGKVRVTKPLRRTATCCLMGSTKLTRPMGCPMGKVRGKGLFVGMWPEEYVNALLVAMGLTQEQIEQELDTANKPLDAMQAELGTLEAEAERLRLLGLAQA